MRGLSRVGLSLTLALAATAIAQQPEPPPYRDSRRNPITYNGPGREEPEPQGLTEVLIGYFGPSDPAHPEGGAIWQAASLAIEEANREGGYKGLPFRLVPAWAAKPWAGGISALVKLVYSQSVWAVIGSIDGASTHLAEQVAPKALITIFNPAASDRTVHDANMPWMFSSVPGDELHIPLLVQAVRNAGSSYVIASAMDHDSRAFLIRLRGALGKAGLAPVAHVEFDGGAEDLSGLGRRVAELDARSVLLLSGPRGAGGALKAIRQAGFTGSIIGNDALGRQLCLDIAGESAEGALFPLVEDPSPALDRFEQKFRERFGRPADFAAAHSYDTARMLVAAVRKAGLNRARIRDAVRELSGWKGVTGGIRFDGLGQNERPVRLGTIRAGRAVAAK